MVPIERPANNRAPPPSSRPSTGDPTPAATQLQEFFPWPPPTPSTRRAYPVSVFGAAATWGDAADRVEELLKKGEFDSWGYYLAPGGFAVVTRVEQLNPTTGLPVAGRGRWQSDSRVASSGSFFESLFTLERPVGSYRIFVIVVTTSLVSTAPTADETRMFQQARRWAVSGAQALPPELRGQVLTDGHRTIVLVYEFDHAPGGRTQLIVPSRWTFDDHVKGAGIEIEP